ncbi:MAG TPA: SH3 domain-containing protein [Ramlibacter sp.]|nr:SH3 domain-containing protein [Ramlibacter sp.]
MKHLARLLLLATACALASAAQAQGQLAFTAKMVNVRAGPARDYPIVAVLPPGFQVGVQGCLPDYSWCDVIAGESRGWVYGGNINYPYQNAYVPVMEYGPIIGIGVLAFVLDDYWGRHYRHRPFFAERHRWINRPAPAPRVRPPLRAGVIGPRPVLPQSPPPRREGPRHEAPRTQPAAPPAAAVRAAPAGPPRQGTEVRRRMPRQQGEGNAAETRRHGEGGERGSDQRR